MKRLFLLLALVGLLCCLSGCCNHEWQEATCTEPRTCVKCGETEGEALGHDYSEWQVTVEPTYSADGEQAKTCSRCGDVITEAIPKKSLDGVSVVDDQGFCVDYEEFFDIFTATLNQEAADLGKDVTFRIEEEASVKGSGFIYFNDFDLQTGIFMTKEGDTPKEDGSFDQLMIVMTGTEEFINKLNATYIMLVNAAIKIIEPSITSLDDANAIVVEAAEPGQTENWLFKDYKYGDFLYSMSLDIVGGTEIFSFVAKPAQ